MIPTIRETIRNYRYPRPGDYRLWPGPNSNTFVAAIMQAVAMKAALPSTAVVCSVSPAVNAASTRSRPALVSSTAISRPLRVSGPDIAELS